MADWVKKGARITGTDRSKLAGELKESTSTSDSTSTRDSTRIDGVPDESRPVPEGTAPQE